MGKEFNRLASIEQAAGFALAPFLDEEFDPAEEFEQAFRNGHKSAARQRRPETSANLPVPIQKSRHDLHNDDAGWLHNALSGLLPRRIAF